MSQTQKIEPQAMGLVEQLLAILEMLPVSPGDLDNAQLVNPLFPVYCDAVFNGDETGETIGFVVTELKGVLKRMGVKRASKITKPAAAKFREEVVGLLERRGLTLEANEVTLGLTEKEKEERRPSALKILLIGCHLSISMKTVSQWIDSYSTVFYQAAHFGSGLLTEANIKVVAMKFGVSVAFLLNKEPCSFNQMVQECAECAHGLSNLRTRYRGREMMQQSCDQLGFTGFEDFIAGLQ